MWREEILPRGIAASAREQPEALFVVAGAGAAPEELPLPGVGGRGVGAGVDEEERALAGCRERFADRLDAGEPLAFAAKLYLIEAHKPEKS